jgi:TrwC relaxase
VAWMRMMGAHSVAYHEHTVAGRGDDPVANALDYYSSRGETPMSWGGSGAPLLGLEGEVDMADWRALFGAGGPRHPESGERLVGCMRPGMELVVSPGKSVAELRVIGRPDDMHQILDAETTATLNYLDQVTREQGGGEGGCRCAPVRTGSPGPCPVTPQPGLATPSLTTMSWSPTWCPWGTPVAAGKHSTRPYCVTTCTPPVPSAAWPRQQKRSSWAMASSPTPVPRGAWAASPSPVSRKKPARSTPTARPRSMPPWPGRFLPSALDGRPHHPGQKGAQHGSRPPAPVAGRAG